MDYISPLPLEIIIYIGTFSVETWRALLVLPDFARWTLSNNARRERQAFIKRTFNGITTMFSYKDLFHNFDDLPAMICSDGTQKWYRHGLLHRDNGPAVIAPREMKTGFWKRVYRVQGPRLIFNDEKEEWWQNGLRHRDNDQPAIINYCGTRQWFQRGKRHRDGDKPAVIEYYGTQMWYQNGLRHRDNDQPAIIFSNGKKIWYIKGKSVRVEIGPMQN